MLSRATLKDFVHKRCRSIQHHLFEYCATKDEEELHLLRVDVKKLKAVVFLLRYLYPGNRNYVKGLKHAYKQAGSIRTAHVNQKTLDKLQSVDSHFQQKQQAIILTESQSFCQLIKHYNGCIEKVEEDMTSQFMNIKNQDVKSFFYSSIQKLSLFFAASPLDENGLHDARKEIKSLLYIGALIPATLLNRIGVNLLFLDKLQHAIGQWHDDADMLTLLQQSKIDPDLTARLEEERALAFQGVVNLTKDFDTEIKSTVQGKTMIIT